MKLAQLLARRKELMGKVAALATLKLAGLTSLTVTKTKRVKAAEAITDVIESAQAQRLSAADLTAEFDFYSVKLEQVDAAIQSANWQTQLPIPEGALDNYGPAAPVQVIRATGTVPMAILLLRRKFFAQKVAQLTPLLEARVASLYEPKITRVATGHENLDDVTVQMPRLERPEIQRALDFYSKRLRLVDDAIQHANWTAEVVLAADVLADYTPSAKEDK